MTVLDGYTSKGFPSEDASGEHDLLAQPIVRFCHTTTLFTPIDALEILDIHPRAYFHLINTGRLACSGHLSGRELSSHKVHIFSDFVEKEFEDAIRLHIQRLNLSPENLKDELTEFWADIDINNCLSELSGELLCFAGNSFDIDRMRCDIASILSLRRFAFQPVLAFIAYTIGRRCLKVIEMDGNPHFQEIAFSRFKQPANRGLTRCSEH